MDKKPHMKTILISCINRRIEIHTNSTSSINTHNYIGATIWRDALKVSMGSKQIIFLNCFEKVYKMDMLTLVLNNFHLA